MRFSIISAALVFAFSVNAATLNKRDVTAATQTCIDDLVAINAKLLFNNGYIEAYTADQGYAGALALQSNYTVLETLLTTAGTDCCAISGTISDEDAQALLPTVNTVVSSAVTEINLTVNKKPAYDSVLLVTAIVKSDLNSSHTKATTISNCVVASAPSSVLVEIQGYADQLESAFQNSFTVYNVTGDSTATTTTDVASAVNAAAAELVAA